MKCLFLMLMLLCSAGAQLTPPEVGWTLIEKGDAQKEGKRTLGVWQNEAKTIVVGAAWDVALPELISFLDWPDELTEDSIRHLPQEPVFLKAPRVGIYVPFMS